jgi:hypothetical protein
MNDGVQRGFGQVRVSFDPDSNPDLPTGSYTTDFMGFLMNEKSIE